MKLNVIFIGLKRADGKAKPTGCFTKVNAHSPKSCLEMPHFSITGR